MTKEILVEKLNEENKLISKEVPENLLSLYLNSGWKLAIKKDKKEEPKFEEKIESKKEVKVDKKVENNRN